MIFNSYAEGAQELSGIRLVSCGHVFAKPEREIYRPQGREDWLLFYVAKEYETFYTDMTQIAEAGSFILFSPGEKQHHVYTGDKTAEFYYVHFSCEALPSHITLKTSQVYKAPLHNRFISIFERIIEETMKKGEHYEALCISELLSLLTLMQREVSVSDSLPDERRSGVARAVQHINRYCDSNMSLAEYADLCCMSKYHFLRVFKSVTGATPIEYRSRIRIEHAKEMLSNGYLSVSEISEALGYTSPAYFSDSFKRATGMSPRGYREREGCEEK